MSDKNITELWIQFSIASTYHGKILQRCNSKQDAIKFDAAIQSGAPWYKFSMIGLEVENKEGPFYFNKKQ